MCVCVPCVCRALTALAVSQHFYAICHRPLIKLYWLKCFIAQRKEHIKWKEQGKERPISNFLHLLASMCFLLLLSILEFSLFGVFALHLSRTDAANHFELIIIDFIDHFDRLLDSIDSDDIFFSHWIFDSGQWAVGNKWWTKTSHVDRFHEPKWIDNL